MMLMHGLDLDRFFKYRDTGMALDAYLQILANGDPVEEERDRQWRVQEANRAILGDPNPLYPVNVSRPGYKGYRDGIYMGAGPPPTYEIGARVWCDVDVIEEAGDDDSRSIGVMYLTTREQIFQFLAHRSMIWRFVLWTMPELAGVRYEVVQLDVDGNRQDAASPQYMRYEGLESDVESAIREFLVFLTAEEEKHMISLDLIGRPQLGAGASESMPQLSNIGCMDWQAPHRIEGKSMVLDEAGFYRDAAGYGSSNVDWMTSNIAMPSMGPQGVSATAPVKPQRARRPKGP